MDQIITRFPPSPTGFLHVGGARTALFNWLYARHTGGKFILRIEDTDTERSTQQSVDAILESLEWLGIDWDEGPYFQTQRFDIYNEYIEKLIESGHAYYCTCSAEEVEAMRKRAMERGDNPKYDGTCRYKKLPRTDNAVVRFAAPQTGTTVIPDVIKGHIEFQNTELDDFIIRRSDGVPTYNLAVVVDDITMGINTIIRGDDHVMNTPKQMLIYKALGEPLPTYGHVPMVLGNDRTRLSKRHGAMSVTAYREMGYLPETMINYLVRLGWSFGDEEFFSREDLIEKFSLDNIGKSASIFDFDRLQSLNADHIQAAAPGRIARDLMPFLKAKGFDTDKGPDIEAIVKTLNTRSKTLEDMAERARFYYADTVAYEEKAAKKNLKPAALAPVEALAAKLKNLDRFDEKSLEAAFTEVMAETELKLGKIAQPVRVALTGQTASPGIFEIIEVLGRDRVMKRLDQAIEFIRERAAAAE